MQVRGTFPELNAGTKKPAKKAPAKFKASPIRGVGGFAIKGRAPKRTNNPKSFAERRAASHSLAYRNKV